MIGYGALCNIINNKSFGHENIHVELSSIHVFVYEL